MTTILRSTGTFPHRYCSALATLLACALPAAFAAHAAQGYDVPDDAFPELLEIAPLPPSAPQTSASADPDAKPTAKQIAKACARVRAKRTRELDPHWANAIVRIDYTCDFEFSDIGEGLKTSATAILRPGAIRFHGIDVVEVRRSASDWGGDDQYVLAARFDQKGKTLVQTLRKHCKQLYTPAWDCDIEPWDEGGFHIRSNELGGYFVHPDPDNRARTIFASGWSE